MRVILVKIYDISVNSLRNFNYPPFILPKPTFLHPLHYTEKSIRIFQQPTCWVLS